MRMRLGNCAALAYVLTLLATPVDAQSTTEDGIRAMLGGDYKAAVRMLKPLADDFERPDPVADLLLCTLDRLESCSGWAVSCSTS